MDTLLSMKVFVRVVSEGSFARAAERMRLSRAVVTKHVMSLEERLRTRLLNRTTRKLSLTETGRTYYEHCTRILGELERAEEEITQLNTAPRGTIRISSGVSFGALHLAPAISEYLMREPEVKMDVMLDDRVVDLVQEGFDVAIRIGELPSSNLVARRLAPSRMVICASPGYLKKFGTPRVPEDLVKHNCLRYAYQATRNEWRFHGPEREHAVRVDGNLFANNGDTLREAALHGLGVCLAPTFIVGPDLKSGRLKEILQDYPYPEQGVFAVYPNRQLPAKVRNFVDFLVTRFAKGPYWDERA